MYLAMLDKLLSYSEAQHDYATGLLYGAQILRYDRAGKHTSPFNAPELAEWRPHRRFAPI